MTDRELMAMALQQLQAGNLAEAEQIYADVLRRDRDNDEVMHLLGVVMFRAARYERAAELIQRAIGVNPNVADYYNTLGEVQRATGGTSKAIESYQKALKVRPGFPEAHSNWGLALARLKDHDAAMEHYRQAIALRPDYPDPFYHMGCALADQGRHEEAVEWFEQALRRRREYPKAWYRAGVSLTQLGRVEEATAALVNAVDLKPDFSDALFDLGCAYQQAGKFDLAAKCWEQTIAARADSAGAMVNLAGLRMKQGLNSEAVNLLERALAITPAVVGGYNNLGNAYVNMGMMEPAIEAYRKAIQIHTEDYTAGSNLLFVLTHDPRFGAEELFDEHITWARNYAEKLGENAKPFGNNREVNRQLRVGYVSQDFRNNQSGFFIEPILARHDREKFFVKCYSDTVGPDEVTKRMQGQADDWQVILGKSDEQFAEQVREDRIDLLVDLTVHAGKHRLLAFAGRAAPIQFTYLGYPYTTGLAAMDYRITDMQLDPPGMSEEFHAEKLLRLPETYFCYRGAEEALEVGPLPSELNGVVTFGSFNRLMKMSAPCVEVWAKILNAVEGSRLLLKAAALRDGATKELVWARFAKNGIEKGRIQLDGWGDLRQYFLKFNEVDIALDPFPFNGGTTTIHGFWMGVPAVTLEGKMAVSRIGVSLLKNVGLEEWIARDEDAYVEKAVELAHDRERLAKIRRELRGRMKASALMDRERFVANLERGYRMAWERWCRGEEAEHITLRADGTAR